MFSFLFPPPLFLRHRPPSFLEFRFLRKVFSPKERIPPPTALYHSGGEFLCRRTSFLPLSFFCPPLEMKSPRSERTLLPLYGWAVSSFILDRSRSPLLPFFLYPTIIFLPSSPVVFIPPPPVSPLIRLIIHSGPSWLSRIEGLYLAHPLHFFSRLSYSFLFHSRGRRLPPFSSCRFFPPPFSV